MSYVVLGEHSVAGLCAPSRLPFWSDDADRYGPACPSLDRIVHDGPYSLGNLRIVLLGGNSLRGRGSVADVYRIARALAEHTSAQSVSPARPSGRARRRS